MEYGTGKLQKREENEFGREEWKRASPLRYPRYPSPEVGLYIDYGVSVFGPQSKRVRGTQAVLTKMKMCNDSQGRRLVFILLWHGHQGMMVGRCLPSAQRNSVLGLNFPWLRSATVTVH